MSQEKIQPFQAISFDLQQAGKRMKATKKKYIWKFKLGDKEHELICSTSHITGKLKIILDGRILLQGQLVMGQPYEHSMMVNGHLLTIQKAQKQTKFSLTVDNKDFTNEILTSKGNEAFKTEETEVEDVQVTKNFGLDPSKKITLNIAAMGDGMKKKKNAVQSQNWKQINKQDISYFQINKDEEEQKDSDDQEQPQNNNNLNDLKIQHINKANTPSTEQFSTMQILFGTTTNAPNVQNIKNQKKQEPPKKQSALDLLNNNFNTMQNLFSTQAPQNTATTPTIPTNTNINPNAQFNTMQAMFATTNPNTQPDLTKNVDNLNRDIKEILKIDGPSNDFNTMQNMFSTNVQGLPQIPVTTTNSQPQQKTILQQFNTMQNMFATGALPPEFLDPKNFGTIQGVPKPPQTTTLQTITPQATNLPMNLDPLNYQNFSTMQNLFATNQLNFPPPSVTTPTTTAATGSASVDVMSLLNQSAVTPATNTSVNPSQFSTIQELFKTGKVDLSQNPLP